MEEEKVNRWRHTFWSFFGVRSNYKPLLGFTLIEVLVVIAVISILAGILVTLIKPVTQLRRARDTQRKSDLSRIQSAFEIYRADLSGYPPTLPSCSLPLTGGTPANTYMNQVPCDPLSPPPIVYIYSTNAPFLTTYCLRACLEDTDDQGRDSPNNQPTCQGVAIAACPAGKVSYTVLNP